MTARGRPRLDWRRIAAALAVAGAGIWVGAATLGARTADAAAIGTRARDALGAGDVTKAGSLARRALRRDPTVVAAVQTLGLAAQAKGDAGGANRLLAYADLLSRRDLQTHLWAIEGDVARGDVAGALREYDLALRTSPGARDLLYPVLAGAIVDPTVAGALLGRLRAAPSWRGDFLFYLATERSVPPALATRFLGSARAIGARLQPPEAAATLVARAVNADELATAWRAYQLIRPGADRRQVRDPTFAALPDTPSPFDWTPSSDGGIVAQSVRQDGASRLDIDAGPGTAGNVVDQLQLLPAGRYRLVLDSGPLSEGGSLAWTFACRDGTPLARVPIASGPARRTASPAFTISPSCDLQHLTLTVDASASANMLHGEVRRAVIVAAAS